MVMMMTSFTRFVIVLSLLRQALGLQQGLPNRIITGVALILTLLVMRPVGGRSGRTPSSPTTRTRSACKRRSRRRRSAGLALHAGADQQGRAGHRSPHLAGEPAALAPQERDFTVMLAGVRARPS